MKFGHIKLGENGAMTLSPRDTHIYKNCGYVLPKKDAAVSGWDSEGSSRHVHCPRCGKITTRYVKK